MLCSPVGFAKWVEAQPSSSAFLFIMATNSDSSPPPTYRASVPVASPPEDSRQPYSRSVAETVSPAEKPAIDEFSRTS